MEHTLAADLLTPTIKQCNLTCLVCTVHMDGTGGAIPTMANVVAGLPTEFPYTMRIVGDRPSRRS
jgi:hypothetical protein